MYGTLYAFCDFLCWGDAVGLIFMGITTGITMGLYETKRFGHHHNHGIIMDIVSCITMGFLKKNIKTSPGFMALQLLQQNCTPSASSGRQELRQRRAWHWDEDRSWDQRLGPSHQLLILLQWPFQEAIDWRYLLYIFGLFFRPM